MIIRKGPEKIGSLLEDLLQERGYATICKEYDVVARWKELMGDRIAEVTECTRVEDGTLYIKVSSAAWRQELVYLKAQLLDIVLKKTGCATIRDFVFY